MMQQHTQHSAKSLFITWWLHGQGSVLYTIHVRGYQNFKVGHDQGKYQRGKGKGLP